MRGRCGRTEECPRFNGLGRGVRKRDIREARRGGFAWNVHPSYRPGSSCSCKKKAGVRAGELGEMRMGEKSTNVMSERGKRRQKVG
jgi:hypothetical protein